MKKTLITLLGIVLCGAAVAVEKPAGATMELYVDACSSFPIQYPVEHIRPDGRKVRCRMCSTGYWMGKEEQASTYSFR